jgi:hypothetical protein
MLDSWPESLLGFLKKLMPMVRDSGPESILTEKNQNSRENRFLTTYGTHPKFRFSAGASTARVIFEHLPIA